MSKIALEGNASGTGTFTVAAPNSNSNYTLTLPQSTGTVVVTGGAQTIEFAAGTASTPSITFTGDTNTGIFSPAADTVAIAAGGSNKAQFGTGSAIIDGLTVGRGAGAVATNTAVGASALASTSSGLQNTAIGSNAAQYQTNNNNTALGYNAMLGVSGSSAGGSNTAIGSNSLAGLTTGNFNTALGQQALLSNTTASNNTAVGYQTLDAVTTGGGNVAFGNSAGGSLTTESSNTFIGEGSGSSTTGGSNTFLGRDSAYLVTSGTKNTVIGRYSGNQGGLDIRTASNYIVLSDGDGNPRQIIDSSGNVGIGVTPSAWSTASSTRAMQFPGGGTIWGQNFGGNNPSMQVACNAYLDSVGYKYYQTGPASQYQQNAGIHSWTTAASGTAGNTITFTERMRIDSNGTFFVNNMSVGGTANLHWSSSNGQFFVTSSSRRFKHDIVEYDKGLAELMQMQPKYFVYNDEPNQKQRAGFIAEDFHDLGMTEYVEYWKDDEGNDTPSEIGYSNMVAILVKAIQELKAINDAQAARIETLETKVAALENK
jgi:hypothetical protein